MKTTTGGGNPFITLDLLPSLCLSLQSTTCSALVLQSWSQVGGSELKVDKAKTIL